MNNLIAQNESLTMSSREIAELTEKRHDHVLRDIKKMLLELYPAGAPNFEGSYLSEQNKSLQLFNLDKKHTDCLLTGYSAKARMLVIERWHELEFKPVLTHEQQVLMIATQLIETTKQRDEAIRTKALIGSKREATAMATASKQSRRVKVLEAQLQDVGSHLSLIGAGLPDRVDTELKANVQTWRLLKEISTELGKDIIKVTDERYGKVNTYHVDVIEQFKAKFL